MNFHLSRLDRKGKDTLKFVKHSISFAFSDISLYSSQSKVSEVHLQL